MSSLADLPELVGFFSYSREDDAGAFGALSALRERIQHELRAQLGRTARTFRIWQDKEAIPSGTLWESEIKNSVAQAVFFIPIITPTVVASPYCRFELDAFLAREAELGRDDLVFPIMYIDVPALGDDARRKNDPVLSLIARRQYVDWRRLRHRDVRTTEAGEAVELFCKDIRDALRRSWISPEERTAQAKAVALQRAEDERKQQEAEERRQEEEARIRVAAARERERADQERRQRETDAERQRAEERRLSDEAQANHRAAEEQHRAEKEERRRQQRSEARPLWPPSRSALAAGSVICLLLIGAIGVWLAAPPAPIAVEQTTPSPVTPSAPVSPAPASGMPPPRASAPPASTEPGPVADVPAPAPAPAAPPPQVTPAPAPVTPAPATPTPAPVEPAPVFDFSPYAPLSPDRERALKPGDTFHECTNCPVMKVVPAGSFMMGSPASETGRKDNEGPRHKVTIGKQFAVGVFAVTVDQFSAFVKETGDSVSSNCDFVAGRSWRKPGFAQTGSHPVVCLSNIDVYSYLVWLFKNTGKNYSSPTEAEYEYAARAGTATVYPWGNKIGKNNANCQGCGSQWDGKGTAPVGSFPPNKFGLYDMVGNASTSALDCWKPNYNNAPADGSEVSSFTSSGCLPGTVARGGSWRSLPLDLRSASRSRVDQILFSQSNDLSFRITRALIGP